MKSFFRMKKNVWNTQRKIILIKYFTKENNS